MRSGNPEAGRWKRKGGREVKLVNLNSGSTFFTVLPQPHYCCYHKFIIQQTRVDLILTDCLIQVTIFGMIMLEVLWPYNYCSHILQIH